MSQKLKAYLAEQKSIADKATPSRWNFGEKKMHGYAWGSGYVIGKDPHPDFVIKELAQANNFDNANFIAQARATVPTLIKIVERLSLALEEINEQFPKDYVVRINEIARAALNMDPSKLEGA